MEDRFTWTQEYKKSWEADQGLTKTLAPQIVPAYSTTRKSIIRQLLVIFDVSQSIEKTDYLPTVRSQIARLFPLFLERFSEENPLSIATFITCGSALQKYSRSFDIANMFSTTGAGDFSFLATLKIAAGFLKHSSYTRECLIITASVGTQSGGALSGVLEEIKRLNIKISIISMCGEVTAFKRACRGTGGVFAVPLDLNHFEIILSNFVSPLESAEATNRLTRFGFPGATDAPGICSCHLAFHHDLYECPACNALVCTLPADCTICGLRLVSPINISKSYHHMYRLKPFTESTGVCRACGQPGSSSCPDCGCVYCGGCAEILHTELNFCIFCPE